MNSPELDKVKNEMRKKAITDRLKQINLEALEVEATLSQINWNIESLQAESKFNQMLKRGAIMHDIDVIGQKKDQLKAEKAKLEAELEQL